MKLTSGMDRFYESGRYFRTFGGQGVPGAEAEEMMPHIYNCFNARL